MVKIGLIGAPGSGKSTFASMLLAELRKQGFKDAGMCFEAATDWLRIRGSIDGLADQRTISEIQREREADNESLKRFPLICDSMLGMGPIYAAYALDHKLYEKEPEEGDAEDYIEEWGGDDPTYTYVICTPLPDEEDKSNDTRIHNNLQALDIELRCAAYVKQLKGPTVLYADKDLKRRQADVEAFVALLKENKDGPKEQT